MMTSQVNVFADQQQYQVGRIEDSGFRLDGLCSSVMDFESCDVCFSPSADGRTKSVIREIWSIKC